MTPGNFGATTGARLDMCKPNTCRDCDEPAVVKWSRYAYCEKHYRFRQMRDKALSARKLVPSFDELNRLTSLGLICPDCGVRMNWLVRDGRKTAVSLQHYRTGAFGFVCVSCNTRHQFSPGDSFCDGHVNDKYCGRCKSFKPRSAFKTRRESEYVCLRSWCRDCFNAYRRERRRLKAG